MQIMIDTDTETLDGIRHAIRMLQVFVTHSPDENSTGASDETAGPMSPPDSLAAAPPPPPVAPLTMSDVISDNDPEIETDDENSVKSVTVSATAAPPPPPVVPAAPPAAAPVPPGPAAAPAPPGPAAAPEYDAKGAPWDGRIHASNRAKKIDGSWKNKRGVSADLITACEAQNKPGNVPSTATGPAAVASAPAASVSIPATPPLPAVPPPPVAPLDATLPAAPSTGAATTIDFRGLMQKIQAATAANKLTAEQVNAALAGVGLKPEEMAQLINNAPLIASLNAAVDACLT